MNADLTAPALVHKVRRFSNGLKTIVLWALDARVLSPVTSTVAPAAVRFDRNA